METDPVRAACCRLHMLIGNILFYSSLQHNKRIRKRQLHFTVPILNKHNQQQQQEPTLGRAARLRRRPHAARTRAAAGGPWGRAAGVRRRGLACRRHDAGVAVGLVQLLAAHVA
jgi:hypothetical protein